MTDNTLRTALQEANIEWSKHRVPMSFKYHPWAYKLFSKDVIERIVAQKPRTTLELIEVRGIGQKLSGQYGDQIIEMVQKHAPNLVVGVDLGGESRTSVVTMEVSSDGTKRVTKIEEYP